MYKFVKDFPIDIIPHMTEDEMIARSKERDSKPKNFEVLMTHHSSKISNILAKDMESSNSIGKTNKLQ